LLGTEPGCILDSSEDVVDYFERWLLADQRQSSIVRRYLRVCHDVCHSAVMFESQVAAIERFRRAEIEIGKVQISAAFEANFLDRGSADRQQIMTALHQFQEPRYLHQTNVRQATAAQYCSTTCRKRYPLYPIWKTHAGECIFMCRFS
jgi:hypothetical protein